MKKYITIGLILIILSSCTNSVILENNNKKISVKECNSSYKLGQINKNDLNLKGVIFNDDLKTVSSPMGGIIDYLNCNNGKNVKKNTLIANISPDFNNPNTANLLIQKSSLSNQKTNLESIKSSTILSFDNQISNLNQQIEITKNNIGLTKKSSNLNKNDLGKQISGLDDTLVSLKNNLGLLEKAKVEALQKINISKESLFTNMNSVSGDNLLKIDETFGITDENRTLNDKYESYLSAKNTALLTVIKEEFLKLNTQYKDITNLSDEDISSYLGGLVELDINSRNAIKASVVNVYFTQAQIDSYYNMFLNYSNNLSATKSSWDGISNSISSINTNYDTQISSIKNQINTTETNLENLKTNKTDSVDVGLDLQLANLDSGLKTLNSNLSNLLTSKKTQILSLDNQILQIEQSIKSLNTNLSKRSIYAGVEGVINKKIASKGNNVGINTPICQIIPNNNSTKIKIYSPVELSIGDIFTFDYNNVTYEITIDNALQYKDQITQNYIYESNYLDDNYFKGGEILDLNYKKPENSIDEDNIIKTENKINKVPVSYVINKINGNFIKINTASGILEKEIKLGDINGNFIEINDGLDGVNEVCK